MSESIRISLADLLPDRLDRLGYALEGQLGDRSRGVPGWPVLKGRFEAGLRSELGHVDLLGLLGEAWTCARELHARRGDDERTEAITPFGHNRVAIDAKPAVSVWIAGLEWPPIKLDYGVAAEFAGVRLVTRGGKVVAAEPGECTISAFLGCMGRPLHDPWTLHRFQLPGVIPFAPGLPIP